MSYKSHFCTRSFSTLIIVFFLQFLSIGSIAQTIGGTGANDDFDGDGIINSIDLDDDNDGVLDAKEGYSCATLTNDAQIFNDPVIKQFNKVINGGFDLGNTGFTTTYSYGNIGACGAYSISPTGWTSSTGSLSEGNAMQINADCAAPFTAFWSQIITVKPNTNYKLGFSIRHGNPARVSYSIDGGTATGNFPTTSNWVSKQAIINSGNRTTIAISLLETTGAPMSADFSVDDIFLIEIQDVYCTEALDTDNDGIFNHFDLDSDGDGCPDALEAGVSGPLSSGTVKNGMYGVIKSTTPNVASAIAAAPYGSNGLSDGVETASESGVINYTLKYDPFAINRSLASCQDTDGDGVYDINDMDDDNDGVLDITEFTSCTAPLNAVAPTAAGATADYITNKGIFKTIAGTISKVSTRIDGSAIDVVQLSGTSSGSITLDRSYMLLNLVVADIDQGETISLKLYDYQNNLIQLSANDIIQLGSNVNVNSYNTNGNSITLASKTSSSSYDGSTSNVSNVKLQLLSVVKRIEFYKTAGANNTWVGLLSGCDASDTDIDGIPNHLDLDSDGDGCSDAIEAKSTTTATSTTVYPIFTSGDDSNTNGLLNVYESTTAGVINYTSSYNPYALSANLASCKDTDSDGIFDNTDLDDDNDGILDAVESPDCFYSENDWYFGNRPDIIVTSPLTMFSPQNQPQKLVDGKNSGVSYDVRMENTTANVNALGSGKEVYRFNMNIPVKLSKILLGYTGIYSHFNDNTKLILRGSNDGSNWTNLSAEVTYDATINSNSATETSIIYPYPATTQYATSANIFTVTQNAAKYQYYDIFWSSGGGINYAGYANEVYFDVSSDYIPSAHPKINCSNDTDGDGILNHQDLDSDGDACPDAKEAGIIATLTSASVTNLTGATIASGTTSSALQDAIIAGTGTATFGNNGFVNLLETASESGAYSGTYNYGIAINKTQSVCLDSDSDGTPDLVDLDDDNDGVLDKVECPIPGVKPLLSRFDLNAGATTTLTQNITGFPEELWVDIWTLDNNFNLKVNNVDITNVSELNFAPMGSTTVYSVPFTDVVKADRTTIYPSGAVWTYPSTSQYPLIRVKISNSGYAKIYGYDFANGVGNYQELLLVNAKYQKVPINLNGTNVIKFGQNAEYNPTYLNAEFNTFNSAGFCDTDGDGVENRLDLDSDGDGCSDAYEAKTTTDISANFKFTTGFGTNGFVDSKETTADNGIYNGYYPYDFAIDASVKACLDTDNDGVPNVYDLDDDNDGILDAVESPSCFYSIAELVKPFSVSSDLFSYDATTNYTLNNSIDGLITNFSAFKSGQFLANKEILKFTAKGLISISGLKLDLAFSALSTNTASTFKLQASQDNVLWEDLSNAPISSTGTTFPTTLVLNNDLQPTKKFKYFRIYGVAGTSSSGGVAEATFNLAASTTASFNPKVSCTYDTDGDGFANHLDLDSDGDACPDAKEATVIGTLTTGSIINLLTINATPGTATQTTNNVASSVASGTYGVNGFADALETATESGVYSGMYTIEYASNKNLNACLDSDGDGINDVYDLDDDNDGILDTQEQVSCYTYGVNLDNISFNGTAVTSKTSNAITTSSPNRISSYSTENFSLPLSLKFNRLSTDGSAMFGLIPAGNTQTPSNYNDLGHKFNIALGQAYGYFDGGVWSFSHGAVTGSEEYSIDISSTGYVTVKINGIQKQAYQGTASDYKLAVTAGSSTMLISNIRLTNAANPEKTFCFDRDTDGDGTPNRLDLDSDNDGCSDAFEAGTTSDRTQNFAYPNSGVGTNGFANVLETSVDNGIYSGTYTLLNVFDRFKKACLDTDGDNVSDLMDLDDDNDGILDSEECQAPIFDNWIDLASFKSKLMSSAFHGTLFRSAKGNYYVAGQYAKPDGTDQTTPTLVTPAKGYNYTGEIIDIAAVGSNSSYAIATTKGIWVWGYLSTNFILPGTSSTGSSPFQQVTLPSEIDPKNIKSISAATNNFMILLQDGTVYTYGMANASINGAGLSDASKGFTKALISANTPLTNISQIEATSGGSFAADAINNKLYTWGTNVYVGNGTAITTKNYATEMINPLPSGTGIAMIDATYSTSMTYLLLGSDRKVYSLGSGASGILGQNSTTNSTSWLNVKGKDGVGVLQNVDYLSAQNSTDGYPSASVILINGQPLSWGDAGGNNMIGLGNSNTLVPKRPDGITDADIIYVIENGGHLTPMLNNKGEIGNVGHNVAGSFADGSTTNRSVYVFNTFERGSDFSDNIAASCNPDIDGDGIPNRLDLDTDGDGCSDAVEAGVKGTLLSGSLQNKVNGVLITSTVNNAIAQGTYGNNGFANLIETSSESGAYSGTYTYDFASDANVSACRDADSDGISDINDLDDDNDGILDTIECPSLAPYTLYTYNYPASSIASNVPVSVTGRSTQNVILDQRTNGSFSYGTITNWKLVASNIRPTAANTIKVKIAPTASTAATYVFADAMLITNGVNTYIIDNNSTNTDGFLIQGPWSQQNVGNAYLGTNSYLTSPAYAGNTASWTFSNIATATSCDVDGDGVANNLDLDSDGDGCPDAKEANVKGTLTSGNVVNLVNYNAGAGTATSTTNNVANAIATGAYGSNGFADAIETSSESGVYSYTYAYRIATNRALNGCLDSDNDNVSDVLDLDDDNDGILDSDESINCITTGIDLNTLVMSGSAVTTKSSNSFSTAGGDVWKSSYSDENFKLPISLKFKHNSTTGFEMFGLIPAATTQTSTGWADGSYKFYSQSTNTYGYFTSAWDFGPIAITTNDILSIDISITGYVTAAVNGVTKRAFQGAVSDYKLVLSSYRASSVTDIVLSDASRPANFVCSDLDTDGDGILNRLDLDSDGDNCPDAREAGVIGTLTSGSVINRVNGNNVTTSVASSIVSANYGDNGFANSVETFAESGLYSGTYNYELATDIFISVCKDTDNDGVSDIVDLDDDNDGVLDITEMNCATTILNKTGITVSSSVTWGYNGTTLANLVNGIEDITAYSTSTGFTNQTILQFNLPIAKALSLIEISTQNSAATLGTTGKYNLQAWNGTKWVNILTNQTFALTAPVLAAANSYTFKMPTNTTAYSKYRLFGLSNEGTVAGWLQEAYFTEQTCNLDIDRDNLPNTQDLDSDGDGCPDAVEAGTTIIPSSGVASGDKLTTSVIPGLYGTNGFANGLETSNESGVYTGTYSYQLAADATLSSCRDTDADGITDVFDLDDDNDGVLDSIENGPFNCAVSPACVTNPSLSASASATGTPPTGWTSFANGGSVDINQGNWQISYGQATPSRTLFPAATANTFFIYGMSKGGSGSLGGWAPYGEAFQQTLNCLTVGQTYYLSFRGAFTHSLGLNSAVSYETTPTSARFVLLRDGTQVSKAPDQLLEATQQMVTLSFVAIATTHTIALAHTADRSTDLSLMVIEAGSGYLCTNKPASSNESLDTDGDGIPNRLDLDSDGDGCSDASEAKTVNSLTATTVIGTYGNNGFANSLETTSESGLYSGTYLYTRATDPTIKACLDSDYDGVVDIDDVDDDNDGILDELENACQNIFLETFGTSLPGPNLPTSNILMTSSEGAIYNVVPTHQSGYWFAGRPDYTPGDVNGNMLMGYNIASTKVVYTKTLTGLTAGQDYEFSAYIANPLTSLGTFSNLTLRVKNLSNTILSSVNTGNILQGNFNWVKYTMVLNAPSTSVVFEIQTNSLGNNGTGEDFVIDDISVKKVLNCDTDGDGIPNQLDLDSDGDGCSDANEAYGLTSAQGTDGNQYYGNSPITVDATGKVNGATYSATSVNVTSVGAASTITTQPTDQSINIGGTAVFATRITAGTGTTTYQWQVSADGGTTWNNVTNSATYIGAGTLTLTVANVPLSMKGYRYRLNLAQSNFVCGNVTSSVAKILMDNTPIVVDETATGLEDNPITGNVLSNDRGSSGSTIAITTFTVGGTTYNAGTTVTIANVGTIIILSDGSFTFTPLGNYNGTVPSIDYTARDANQGTDVGTLFLTITPVNDVPLAVDDAISTNENTAVSGNTLTLGIDSDADGNGLTITQFSIIGTATITYNVGDVAVIPGVGSFTMNVAGAFTFTPTAGYTGNPPGIDYTISDANGGSDIGRLQMTVVDVNDAPLATDDIQTINQYTTATGNLLTNDADVDANATLTITQYSFIIGGTTYTNTTSAGVVTMTGVGTINITSSGAYTFIPSSTYTGTVPAISYTLSDGTLTDNALLDIFVQPVNNNPVANNDVNTTNEDTPVSGNVITNDTDTDGHARVVTEFSFTITSGSITSTVTYPAGTTAVIPNVGTIIINTNGTYTFTPFVNYNGTVPVINYKISDGHGGTANANLAITVTQVNDNPIAVNDDDKVTPEDTPVTVNVLTNDSDPDGDNSVLEVTQFTIAGITGAFTSTANIPGKGTLTAMPNGDFTFTPLANFNGALPTITYTVSDGTATNTASLNITVTPVNDAPTVIGETITTPENTAIAGNLLTNDTDIETGTASNTITQFVVAGVGTATAVTYTAGSIVDIPNVGTIIVNANGTYTFTPVQGYFGIVPAITYKVADPNGGTATGVLAITVSPVNDPPIVVNEAVNSLEDIVVTGDLLANDSDPEQARNLLTITQFTIAGISGTFTASTTQTIPGVGTIIVNANGTYTFTPNANYNGIAPLIEYTVSDGQGASTNGNLTIVVGAVNDAPIVVSDIKSEPVNTPITGNVLSNDRDVEAATLTVSNITIAGVTYPVGQITTITGVGTILMNADGSFTFTPALNYVGAVPTISYTVTDGTLTSTGTLSLTITPIDTDGDGIPDATEKGTGASPLDTDGDTIPDWLDADSDGDGIPDNLEDAVCIGFLPCTPTDTDGDGTPDYRDTDSDGDGILDATEDAECTGNSPCTPTDTDGDGTPNHLDLDSDGDGISDTIEKGPTSTPRDSDTDSTPDYLDLDSDGDGIADNIEKGSTSTPVDTDNDGTLDFRDLDSDGDGIPDVIEKGTGTTPVDRDGDGVPDYLDTDSDGDGILDTNEDSGCTGTAPCTPTDTDGDGTPDYLDLDSDNDGIEDKDEKGTGTTPVDTDGDGTPDFRDLDSDGDTIVDAIEKGTGATLLDTDNDGIPNFIDIDSDGDGIPDRIEKGSGSVPLDTDGDGTPDYLDIDSDGDGIPDSIEDAECSGTIPCTPTDTDRDGIPNYKDLDSDGDGITDTIEKGANGSLPADTDSDGTPDYIDTDSDGDGISDEIEKGPTATPLDTDGDGIPDYRDTDSDGDGISDLIEKGPTSTPVDTDLDGTPDYRDLDSDGDGKTDQTEGSVDTDLDGTPNFRDLDSDGDGVLDAVDQCPLVDGLGSTSGCPPDTDGDGLTDSNDLDDDNDGILDTVEAGVCSPTNVDCDTDGDRIPNRLDKDSDGDGINDVIEAGGTDADADGIADGTPDNVTGIPSTANTGITPPNTDGTGNSNPYDLDSDGDGISDAIEKGTGVTLADTDSDGTPDYLDTDSDGDGITDEIEKGTGTSVADTDNDGIPDFKDLDSDGDAIPDAVEKGTLTNPVDTDNDGIPNFRDQDSDGDGITDITEDIICVGSGTCSPTDSDTDGTPDYLDVDSDGDGIPDTIEKGSGTNPVDTDIDGTPDYLDTDADGDGILDSVEDAGCTGTAPCTPTDTDGDGIPNFKDVDSDGDGISDTIEKGADSTPDNSDADTIPDYLDSDSDGDGISDAIEKGSGTTPADTDGDGTPDYLDVDSDGDGIPDAIEKGTTTSPVDTDSDGIPDFLDTDTDGDGIPDSVEDAACSGTACTPTDTDGDGIPNHKDVDSDGDGIPDAIEKGTNGLSPDNTDATGNPDYLDTDSDDDGIPDSIEKGLDGTKPLDTDGDGVPDYKDIDSDGDGIPDIIEDDGCTGTIPCTPTDTDGDGKPDYRDTDADNDGILDATEDSGCTGTVSCTPTNSDTDAIPNYRDPDSDGDNKTDLSEGETDLDGDTIPNYLDTDADGDGVLDNVDQCPLLVGLANLNGCPVDTDGDGVYDLTDSDDDNDGITDAVESGVCSPTNIDCDTDGDGIPNRIDPDSDDDGIPDVIESNGTDSNGDGKVDGGVDANGVPTSSNGGVTPPNTDGATLTDPYDTDSDGDGITDAIEKGAIGNSPVDTDGDGIPDYRDIDSDNDGIPDAIERGTGTSILDSDGDGIPDYKDTDSDDDGILDATEDAGCTGTIPCTPTDTDGDGIPNYRDIDSDGDGINDSIEKGTGSTLLDTDTDGIPNYLDTDSDGDGISDAIEKGLNPNNPIDTDGDGKPDYLDTDSDNDGIPDAIEKGANTTPADTDGDGVPNYRDTDSDGDGIIDATEDDGCTGTAPCTPTDTDGDGIPNYVDLDTDGDGKSDAVEKGPTATPMDSDRDGIPDYRDVDNLGNADVNVTNSNVAVTGNLKTNDEVPVGTTYKQPAANASNPSGATLVVNTDGTYSFTATTPGKYIYFVPVCGPNQINGCPLSPLEITVLDPLNMDKPVANNDFATIAQGTPIVLNVLANDKAGDAFKTINASSLTVTTAPKHGTAVVNNDGTIRYTPSPYFVGTDSLVYQVCDNNNPVQCQTAVAYFKIEPTGVIPVTTASDDYVSIISSTTVANTVTGTVLLNDQNVDGGTLSSTLITGPTLTQGTLVFNSNGTYAFTPAAGFVGPINIVYEVCGGSPIDCAKATLHILVNPPPTLENDAASAYLNIPKTGSVATNDVATAGTTYGTPIADPTNPAVGNGAASSGAVLTMTANGTYTFTATVAGTYTYTVPVCAPGQTTNCPTTTIVFTVPVNTLVNDAATAFVNIPKTGNVSTNDVVPVGTTYGTPVADPTNPAVGNGAASSGAVLTMTANGTYTFTATVAGTYTYTVPVCAPGQTTNCPTTTIVFTVPVNTLVNDAATAFVNIPKTGNVSTNDVVPVGTTYGTPVADPTNPAVGNGAASSGAVLTMTANGTYTFTATVAGTYTYTVPVCSPGQTTNCPSTTIVFTVPVNTLINDVDTGYVNIPKTGSIATNDVTPTGTTYGTPVADPTNPALGTGTASSGAVLTMTANGTYTFTATVAGTYTYTVPVCAPGQTIDCPTTIIVFTVPVNTLVNDAATAFVNIPMNGSIATNDVTPTGTTYGTPIADPTNPAVGNGAASSGAVLTMTANGTYTFTATVAGTYTYTVPVCAPGQTTNCPTTTIVFTVPVNTLVNDAATAFVNIPKNGSIATNDVTPTGTTYGTPVADPTNPVLGNVAASSGAVLTMTANGTYTFTATVAGTYTYTVPVCAPGQTIDCPTTTIVFTVPVNTLVNDAATAFVNIPKTGNVSTNDVVPVGTTYGTPVADPTNPAVGNGAASSGAVLTMTANGTYTFTATVAGTYTYTVPVCAPGQTIDCPSTTIVFTVPVNTLVNDIDSAYINIPKTGNVSTNDVVPVGTTYGTPIADPTNPAVGNGAASSGAVLTMTANGTYTFTATVAGTYTYTVPVCAPGQTTNCPSTTIVFTVPVNTLINDVDTGYVNIPKTGSIATNDVTPTGTTYGTPVADPTNPVLGNGAASSGAVLTMTANGTYTFTATVAGTYTYTVPVCAPGQTIDCPTTTIVFTVPVNKLVDDVTSAIVKVPISGSVATNDVVPTGTTYGQPVQLTGATITVGSNGTYTFTATIAGTYTYTIPVCAPGQTTNCPTEILVIVVTDPTPPPVTPPVITKILDVTKVAGSAILNLDGTFDLTFTIKAYNLTKNFIDSVLLKDDLTKVFDNTNGIKVVSVSTSGNLIRNANYDGIMNTDLVTISSTLDSSKVDSILLRINVPSTISGNFQNTVIGSVPTVNGVITTLSTDPTRIVSPNDTIRKPTLFVIPKIPLNIPEGFSPNNDGIDDTWVIRRSLGTKVSVWVINRWGNEVYKNLNYNNDWRGKGVGNILGEDLPEGTYYYIVHGTDIDGKLQKLAGSLTIKR